MIFIIKNFIPTLISFSIIVAVLIIISIHEYKYEKNSPYRPHRYKRGLGSRIWIGLIAGVHYLFFIGSYDHKKYNTQVWYPETFECVFGNISELVAMIGYIFISIKLFQIFGYYSIIFMVIPLVTNIASIIKNRVKK